MIPGFVPLFKGYVYKEVADLTQTGSQKRARAKEPQMISVPLLWRLVLSTTVVLRGFLTFSARKSQAAIANPKSVNSIVTLDAAATKGVRV